MSRWIIKTALQRGISLLPASHRWNELFQRYVTKGIQLNAPSFETKIACCRNHLDHYFKFSPSPRQHFSVLELGTGAWPIVPIGLYLCGAEEIRSFDIVPLLRDFTVRQTLDYFCRYDAEGALIRLLPRMRPDRMANLRRLATQDRQESPELLLANLNMRQLIQDARKTALPDGSIDLIFSTVALEHIPSEVIAELFAEFQRVCSRSGVMSHYIGLADQYAGFDNSITPFNFLKFSSRSWRILNNPMIPLTRLRIPEYRKLVHGARFRTVREMNVLGTVADLQSVKLAPEFREYSTEDLLVLFSWIVSVPA